VAARNNLTLTDTPQNMNVTWSRISQRNETDLQFLRRLALAHNYDFSIRGSQLVFYSRTALEQQEAVLSITRMMVKSFEFKSGSDQIYKSSTVAYHDPHSKSLIGASYFDANAPTGDDLYIPTRVENAQQAQVKAQSALHDANMYEVTGRLETEGTVLLVAGVNLDVSGFGNFDGTYHIESSRHRLERSSGYSTEIEVRQL
jgi:phage protein D